MSRMLQIIRTTVTSSLNGVISRQLVKQNVHEQTGKRWSSSLTVKNLKGKRAVITGSTSGIGLGIAEKLAAEGCNIMLNGLVDNMNNIKTLMSKMSTDFGVRVEYHPADMSKPAEIRSLIATAASKFGGVDILVNNAGIQFVSPVESFPEAKWDQIIAINLTSNFHTIKEALPFMKQNKWGRIINISSVHGLVASIHKSAYVASKHGVVGLTKTVALETAGTGVTCNCINPGWVRTQLVERQIEAKANEKKISVEQASEELLAEKQPSKQFVTVDQIADTVAFLCSDSASQITGICVPVDGGWTSQ